MRKYVKFTGDFKQLIPDGWKFHKLFARNYRSYSKTSDGKEYGETFWIWQHLGGYVEYEDWFSLSWIIFDLVQSGEYKEGKWHQWYRFTINRESQKVSKYIDPIFELKEDEISDFYNKNRQLTLSDTEINFIKDLFNKKLVEIVEDKRKIK